MPGLDIDMFDDGNSNGFDFYYLLVIAFVSIASWLLLDTKRK